MPGMNTARWFQLSAGVLITALPAPGAEAALLRNAGFESALVQEDWEKTVYGAASQIEPDTRVARQGNQSLRVTAMEPSDAALGQEITLRPAQWYRLSGWVKTRALEPRRASVFGTLQVQQSRGRGVIATGPNHAADTDWTEVPVFFRAPPDGRVRISLFFAGFGKGTGTAWFDDLRLSEIDPADSPARVTREPLCAGQISPLQYGQFVEYLCDLVPAMWAEKLYDGSFEGLSPYKFVFLKETDFKEKPWHPSGAVDRAKYTLDRETKISGDVSQRIEIEAGAPATVGISQDGIFVESNAPCVFNCFMRASGLHGPVRVKLQEEGKVLAASEFQPGAEWKKYSARLVPSERGPNATLTIEFRGPATLWLDNASLMPIDTVGGWRRDVVEAVRLLKPGIIRFGGSALDDPNLGEFEWKDTIGDPDRRRPFRAWGGLQPTGPGLEEGGPRENATVEVHPDGSATILTGTSPHGQGHATVWAMLASDELGIPVDRITVKWGDTDLIPEGGGTGGSRSLQQGGAAVQQASRDLLDVARQRAADELEASPADLVFDVGRSAFAVAGDPDAAVPLARLAEHERLFVRAVFTAPGATFPFGAHVAVAEVDTETGKAVLRRVVTVDDAGTVMNPLLAEGQRHGGIAQGAAQALLEEVVYDADGNPLTSSFADYAIVTATEVPTFELADMETPTSYNPLGAKGIGEAGTIGSTPAVQNAIIDAVAHLGVRHIDMPASPQRVWAALRAASASASAGDGSAPAD